MSREIIARAIALGGGPTEVGRKLGVAQSTVSNWESRGSVPARRARGLAALTGGEISEQQLCPEVFGAPVDLDPPRPNDENSAPPAAQVEQQPAGVAT